MLERIGTVFRRGRWNTKGCALRDFPRPDEFARLLEIERHRADRAESVFSLLTFTPSNKRTEARSYECLADILPRRLRVTDHFGWLDNRRIGVIFPDTQPAGAWKAADDVCRQFTNAVPKPICAVLSYPGSEPSEFGGHQEADRESSTAEQFEPVETLFLMKTPLWKRAIDILGASVGLVIVSPLMLVAALAIKLTSAGPVLYTQMRSGRGGKPFRIYKFRSMVIDADRQKERLLALNEQDGPAFKLKNDPRVTPIGRFLRTTSIDELPQLWNVLRGEMTLVGPRAMYCPEVERCAQWQKRRLDVTQGITCFWQVRGRSSVGFDEWMRMDLEYIRRRSVLCDLALLARTVPAVLSRRGAH
jgi:lipopolysaccharide/colanic/teichoic acid biosynthesis glycosyltransferase